MRGEGGKLVGAFSATVERRRSEEGEAGSDAALTGPADGGGCVEMRFLWCNVLRGRVGIRSDCEVLV